MTEIENLILETLSFYDPIIREHLILQMDNDKVSQVKEFTNEGLDQALKSLLKKKKIKRTTVGPDEAWIKIFPKRSLWKKIKALF